MEQKSSNMILTEVIILRKLLLGLIICGFVMSFAACEFNNVPSSYVLPASSGLIQQSDSIISDDHSFVNKSLVDLVGVKNSVLKTLYSGDCFASGTGLGFVGVAYFDPYIDFFFVPPPNGPWSGNYEQNLTTDYQDYLYPVNPFTDEMEVIYIDLIADYDIASHSVTNQDSLKQLLVTNGEITYDLLAEKLLQTPALIYTENVYYSSGAGFGLNDRTPGVKIQGGTHRATYCIANTDASIEFIREGDTYIALHIRIGALNPTDLLP